MVVKYLKVAKDYPEKIDRVTIAFDNEMIIGNLTKLGR
jgi:hypothetical protein|tara:strand:- start:867 stop:980 length:114 start_codon:yes stop_codon:yes gene_type:complete